MDLTEKLQLAYQLIRSARQILIIGHTSPDADALSSVGAMFDLSTALGSEVYAFADKKALGTYDFIPHVDKVSAQAPADLRVFDVILILDCGSLSRTAIEEGLRKIMALPGESRPFVIEFDHHQPVETYADLEIRLTEKASTTEIVHQFFKVNELEINKEVANCILIGLMTDTGHFLHANSSREAISVSSEMLLAGASLPKIIDHTVHNKSFSALKVWGRALENMKFNSESGLASSALTAGELDELLPAGEREANADLFGDIVSFMASLAGVRAALLLREEEDKVKGSLRTNDDGVDVAKIAANFGGGGHKKASGFSVKGKLQKTEMGWKVIK